MSNFCPKCGNHLSIDNNFCTSCGTKLKHGTSLFNKSNAVLEKCGKCKGTGIIEEYRGDPGASIFMRGIGTQKYTCDVCGGKGKVRI